MTIVYPTDNVHKVLQAKDNLPEPYCKSIKSVGSSVNGIFSHPPSLFTSTAVGHLPTARGVEEDDITSKGQEHLTKKLVIYQIIRVQ